jgi:hypothetical protein
LRIGTEAKHVHRDDVDELVRIAVSTLKPDVRRVTKNIQRLFAKQLEAGLSTFFYITETETAIVDGVVHHKLEVLKCNDLSELNAYEGELTSGVPRLFKLPSHK